jgi:hypothetical protein
MAGLMLFIASIASLSADIKPVLVQPSALKVSIHLSAGEYARFQSGEKQILGISGHPDIKPSVSAEVVNSHGAATVSAYTAGTGWIGGAFIQWLSIETASPRVSRSVIDQSMDIMVTISFNKVVYDALKTPVVKNRMVIIPARNRTAKSQSVDIPNPICSTGVTMEIPKDGIYAITGRNLREIGVPVSSIIPRYFRLHSKGIEVPVYITEPYHERMQDDDTLLFYGKELRGSKNYYEQFSNTSAFRLTWSGGRAGLRIGEAPGENRRERKTFIDLSGQDNSVNAPEFNDTLHIEKDNDIRWLGDLYETIVVEDTAFDFGYDNWFWEAFGNKEISDFSVNIPSPSASSALCKLRIAFMGLTSYSDIVNDHRFQILLNGYSPGRVTSQFAVWDGQSAFIFESEPFPAKDL